jgi:hypothetical protein
MASPVTPLPCAVAVADTQPADPVVKAGAEAAHRPARDPEQCLDLVGRQLDPEQEAGAGRIQKEVVPEAGVREQPAQGALHIPLAHPVLL